MYHCLTRVAAVTEPWQLDAQDTGDAEGHEAAEQATTEIAQSLPRVRTSLDEERPAAAADLAANGPDHPKARLHDQNKDKNDCLGRG